MLKHVESKKDSRVVRGQDSRVVRGPTHTDNNVDIS